jgi:hypothetical protein
VGITRIAEKSVHFSRAEIEWIDGDNVGAVLIHGNFIHALDFPAEFDTG